MRSSSHLQGSQREVKGVFERKVKGITKNAAIVNPDCPHYVDIPTLSTVKDPIKDYVVFMVEASCSMCGKMLSMTDTASRKDIVTGVVNPRVVKDALYVKFLKQWGPRRGRYRSQAGATMPQPRVRPAHMESRGSRT